MNCFTVQCITGYDSFCVCSALNFHFLSLEYSVLCPNSWLLGSFKHSISSFAHFTLTAKLFASNMRRVCPKGRIRSIKSDHWVTKRLKELFLFYCKGERDQKMEGEGTNRREKGYKKNQDELCPYTSSTRKM